MGESVAIFGSGLSGSAAEKLARALGHRVTCFDQAEGSTHRDFGPAELEAHDRFVFSPGFAAEHPWRRAAEVSGKRVQSELGFAAEQWTGQLIGVTGTNGKTSLTHLMAKALQCAGEQAEVAGNIGRPLSDLLLRGNHPRPSIAVCEISSFQAELIDGVGLDALLWTNFAEDHLDRYEGMAEYFRAKANLLNCLKPGAIAVLGESVAPWFKQFDRSTEGLTVAGNELPRAYVLSPESIFTTYPQSENFLLASAYWHQSGRSAEGLVEAANRFRPVPHRLDVVGERLGVTYWNDSKSTNFHAALAATRAVPRPIVWIGGGRMKGGDLEKFSGQLAKQIDSAVLYGEAGWPLKVALEGKIGKLHFEEQFSNAVRRASLEASGLAPSNVLLSPAFSSLDQFSSYEERGKTFISIVLSL